MGLLANLVIAILVVAFLILIAFFGRLPALRHTPVAWLHRLIWIRIPRAVLAADQRLTSGRLTSSISRFFTYMLYDKHPTILVFFLLLLTVGEILYLPGAWPRLSRFNQVFGFISIVLPYWFLYKAAYTDPGIISSANHARYMSHYPYDFTLFHPGQVCKTCLLLKPARSKHCSVCKRCVARMDHHCVFINNCVGYANQHYFLLLLLTTAWLTTYGAVLGFNLVRDSAIAKTGNDNFALFKRASMPWQHYFLLLMIGIQADVGVGSVTLLTTMTTPMVWALLGYHVYLIWCGTTTNESMKWSDWKIEMDEGCAFKRSLHPPPPLERHRDHAVEPAWTRWPVEAMQILVRTEDGHPPHKESPYGFGEWERVWSLREVENLYDIGFWDNLTDIMIKEYSFRAEGRGGLRDDDEFAGNEDDVEAYGSRERLRGGSGGSGASGSRDVTRDVRRAHKERARRSKKPNIPTVSGIVNAAT
ncbi:DHHC palmitoyltransferase-domain-containing protein [Microdochium trichocladiopsis]|uniref:Palmitoyltransferase n=1 Tax=Microdochium trichocladiopsis TaxID=1682393 RepID=A0A9P8Y4G2_9PEZI|nr:DHHC palmitoyltransferase-domain-containing protein [Microdochium trichocladiopsis]KAH7029506.1 DHHC palmitoyltransferase-domain-containing protein [Microdochium trichocladiopsis]